MTKKQKQIIGGGVALCLLLLAGGFFLLVKPKKSQIDTIKGQAAAEQTGNATLRSQIAMLQQQQAGLVGKQVLLHQVSQRIPSNSDIPDLLRQLTQIHTDAGVDVVGITPGTPSAASGAAGTATTATAAGATSATTTTTTATTPGSASAATYQTIPITLSVLGDYSHLVIFFNDLEKLQRLFLVKGLTLTPSGGTTSGTGSATAASSADSVSPNGSPELGDTLTATVSGEVYETSPDTTSIDLPALNGATTASGSTGTAPVPAATPTTSVN